MQPLTNQKPPETLDDVIKMQRQLATHAWATKQAIVTAIRTICCEHGYFQVEEITFVLGTGSKPYILRMRDAHVCGEKTPPCEPSPGLDLIEQEVRGIIARISR